MGNVKQIDLKMMKYIQEGTKKERNKIIWKRTYSFEEEEIELLKTHTKKRFKESVRNAVDVVNS